MKEVEVKARIRKPEELRAKLAALGCQFSEPITQDDTVYLRRPLEIKDGGQRGIVALRIRRQAEKNILTVKKQLENGLDKIEHEIVFDDPAQAHAMIEVLDFHVVSHVNKIRQKSVYNDLEICLDEVEGLGSFIEVEKMVAEEHDSEAIQAELFSWLISLGIKEEDRATKGYDIMMYEERMRDRGI
jgi:adenylate cyclase class 2